jgi:hypothetical protein
LKKKKYQKKGVWFLKTENVPTTVTKETTPSRKTVLFLMIWSHKRVIYIGSSFHIASADPDQQGII